MSKNLLEKHPLPWSLTESGAEDEHGVVVERTDEQGHRAEIKVVFVVDANDDEIIYCDSCSESEKEALRFLVECANKNASQ